jgi:hypothetical protein
VTRSSLKQKMNPIHLPVRPLMDADRTIESVIWETAMPILKFGFTTMLALAVVGCASSIMNGFVGRPLQSAMVRYGPPTNAFDMPDGTRAFQWVLTNNYSPPVQSYNSGSAYTVGNRVHWYQNTSTIGGQPINSECAYTMYGSWDEQQNSWVMSGFEEPSFLCQ